MRKTILIFVREGHGGREDLIANVVAPDAALRETGVLKESALADLLEKVGLHCPTWRHRGLQLKLLYLVNGFPIQWQIWEPDFSGSDRFNLELDSGTPIKYVVSGKSDAVDLPDLRAE